MKLERVLPIAEVRRGTIWGDVVLCSVEVWNRLIVSHAAIIQLPPFADRPPFGWLCQDDLGTEFPIAGGGGGGGRGDNWNEARLYAVHVRWSGVIPDRAGRLTITCPGVEEPFDVNLS